MGCKKLLGSLLQFFKIIVVQFLVRAQGGQQKMFYAHVVVAGYFEQCLEQGAEFCRLITH